MATRRSPRSIERLCKNTSFDGCSPEQTALLLSLSQCTGWSADRICLKMKDISKMSFKAEDVWNFHWRWVLSRGGSNSVTVEEAEIMKIIMKDAGVEVTKLERPLNMTVQPKTILFMKKWSPKNLDGHPLIPGFTHITRNQTRQWLALQKKSAYGKPSPSEELVIASFGSSMCVIIKDCLKRWVKAMRLKLKDDPPLRPIREKEHIVLIMQYLSVFQDAFEGVFGAMEPTKTSALGHIKDNTVYIRSTAYAAKVFLGLLMADRLFVVERLRREERERIAFLEVEEHTIEEDCKNCPICQDPMGIENPEGIKETPIKLVVCCGQFIGESCMKVWLRDFAHGNVQRDTCPICRHVFGPSFVRKLFKVEDDSESSGLEELDDDIEDSQVMNLLSPSPEAESGRVGDVTRLVFVIPVPVDTGVPEVRVEDVIVVREDDHMMMEG